MSSSNLDAYLPGELDRDNQNRLYSKYAAKIERRFGINPKSIPLEELVKIDSIDFVEEGSEKVKLRDLLRQRKRGYFKKKFKLGKIYWKTPIAGVKVNADLSRLTEYLIYGLISRKPELVYEAEKIFDKRKLAVARKYVSVREIYRNIKEDLEDIKKGSEINAQNALDFIRNRYRNRIEITDLIDSIENKKVDYVVAKMQTGNLHDLFDNRRFGACTFYPDGGSEEEALNYALDRNIGLLHLIPVSKGKILEPTGVAICLNTRNRKKKKCLLLESYESKNEFNLNKNLWASTIFKALRKVARDNKAKYLIINSKALDNSAKNFINYAKIKYSRKPRKIYLSKIGGVNFLRKYYSREEILNDEAVYFSYLESFKDKGNKKTKGIVKGMVFRV